MSRKTKGAERRRREKPPRVGRMKLVAAALALCAVAAGVAATRYDAVRRAVGLPPLIVSPAQGNAPPQLSKEYVYAGGRLVATEEPTPAATPTPTPAGPSPTNLVATATSASSVSLAWTPPEGSVVGYVVERRGAAGSQETPTGSTSASFNDTTPPGDYAYLYRVKAVYAGGTSDYGNADLATTVIFQDAQLQGGVIQAVHLTELRRAVYLEDVTDLRARLDEATGPLGLTTGYPASPPLARGAVVSAQHFEQIRARVR